jgi:hypothetical protein
MAPLPPERAGEISGRRAVKAADRGRWRGGKGEGFPIARIENLRSRRTAKPG